MEDRSLTAAVRGELLARAGVTEREHRFGGIAFHVGRHEIGHLHGDTEADLPLPQQLRAELAAAGRIAPHHATAESCWVSRRVAGPQDVAEVVELFRISYAHAAAQAAADAERQAAKDAAPAEEEPAPRRSWRGRGPILARRNRR